jgi:hypothetical protein
LNTTALEELNSLGQLWEKVKFGMGNLSSIRVTLYPQNLALTSPTSGSRSVGIIEVEVNLRPTVSRPVCIDVRRPSGTREQIFLSP